LAPVTSAIDPLMSMSARLKADADVRVKSD
jgi:hypothetical protein